MPCCDKLTPVSTAADFSSFAENETCFFQHDGLQGTICLHVMKDGNSSEFQLPNGSRPKWQRLFETVCCLYTNKNTYAEKLYFEDVHLQHFKVV